MKLEKLIKRYNGHLVWKFSHDNFYSLVGSREGVCMALCAFWIRYHSHNDSLANYIGSDQRQYLNKQLAKYMVRLNNFFNPKYFDRHAFTLFLQMHGILPLYSSHERTVLSFSGEEVLEKLNYRKDRKTYGSGYNPQIDARIIDSLAGLDNCYAVIILESTRSGHGICVWLGKSYDKIGDACLFDANLGEIWFSNRQYFTRFFPDLFNAWYRFKDYYYGWHVLPYASV